MRNTLISAFIALSFGSMHAQTTYTAGAGAGAMLNYYTLTEQAPTGNRSTVSTGEKSITPEFALWGHLRLGQHQRIAFHHEAAYTQVRGQIPFQERNQGFVPGGSAPETYLAMHTYNLRRARLSGFLLAGGEKWAVGPGLSLNMHLGSETAYYTGGVPDGVAASLKLVTYSPASYGHFRGLMRLHQRLWVAGETGMQLRGIEERSWFTSQSPRRLRHWYMSLMVQVPLVKAGCS